MAVAETLPPMQVMEAQNHDWEARYEEWFLGGKLGPAPRCPVQYKPRWRMLLCAQPAWHMGAS